MTTLTKAQKEFFTKFTKTAIQNLLISQTKPEYTAQVLEASAAVLEVADLTTLRDAIAEGFMALVDFKTLSKVDKFLRSEEYVKTNQAANEVISAVETELGEMLHSVALAISETVEGE